ncbi:ROK family protein [Nonomuraea fastidiosa]|jgi:predicted NBD/HSP70 family sugar kinase|uniref:ROK family transcriptional regulator n=1 Tax=Nonomuraea TaxID=83681 RepID=UPI00342D39A1
MADLRGGDLSRLRQLNTLTAIRALRGAGPLTLSALAERTGLSRPSMKEVTDELMALGWVEEVPPSPGTMGRPARRYRFRADSGYLVGVDIGGHNIRAAVSDLDGRILAETRRPVAPDAPLDERLSAIEQAVSGCLTLSHTAISDVWTISAGTIGVIDVEGHVVYSAAVPAWRDLDLAGKLREMFPCQVLIENDSRLAAMAETRRGVAKGAKDVVFLHVGRRMGAGLIIGGKVHRGFGAAAGEISMLEEARWFDAPEHLQRCASVPPGTPPEDAAGHTLAAARDGDPVAIEAVERYVDDLAVGTAAMVLILDPQMVVLGGGFSRSADVLLDRLRDRLERRCMRLPEVRASALGDECVVAGAIDYAVEHLDEQLFTPDAGPLPVTR